MPEVCDEVTATEYRRRAQELRDRAAEESGGATMFVKLAAEYELMAREAEAAETAPDLVVAIAIKQPAKTGFFEKARAFARSVAGLRVRP